MIFKTVCTNFIFFYMAYFIFNLSCFWTVFTIFKFKFSFYDTYFVPFALLSSLLSFRQIYVFALNPTNSLLLTQQILSWFVHLIHFWLIQRFFIFSFKQWSNSKLEASDLVSSSFPVLYKIFCFHIDNEVVCIHPSFAFSLYFGFT